MAMARTPKKRKGTGKYLEGVRTALGLTIEEAAAKVKVSRVAWQDWETGRRKPSESTLLLISLLEKGLF